MIASPRVAQMQSVALGLCFAWAAVTDALGPLMTVGTVVLAWAVVGHRGRWTPQGHFGAANVVTTIRAVLALVVGLLPLSLAVPWAGVAVFLFFVLDGVDGTIAQRTGTASAFGAAFDTETDALLVAIASIVVVKVGLLGPWVLVVGGLRYAYVVVTSTRIVKPEPPSRWGRWAFSAWMTALSAALCLPHPVTVAALGLSAIGVVVSFGRSFVWAFTEGAPQR
ncbi:MAG: CDP-alcohol phosphatidyltransferase family protein [Myxococcota bacterium]